MIKGDALLETLTLRKLDKLEADIEAAGKLPMPEEQRASVLERMHALKAELLKQLDSRYVKGTDDDKSNL